MTEMSQEDIIRLRDAMSMAVDSHDDVKWRKNEENSMKYEDRTAGATPIGPSKLDKLIDGLAQSYKDHDDVYMEIVEGAKVSGEKFTESRLAVAVRDEMRIRGLKHPEIAKWQLRAALGGVESHGD